MSGRARPTGAAPVASNGDLPSILLVHNRYRQAGGEDVVFESESSLLEGRGHRVERFSVDNSSIPASRGPIQQAALAAGTVWSRQSARDVQHRIRAFRPAVLHVHNTFPLLSPSIYEAAADEGVPVVQTLHNYRLVCPEATLFREGRPCEDCVGRRVPWPGVLHACYHGSRLQSAVVASMLAFHNARATWDSISIFIALSEFGRRVFIRGGLPAERVVVKRNFVDPDPGGPGGPGGRRGRRDGFVFAGRLSEEKGVETLIRAWQSLPADVRLTVIGDGPLGDVVRTAAAGQANIEMLGSQDRGVVLAAMAAAQAVIVPSIWYEAAPLTLIEAFGCGVPVIGSRLGSLEEAIEHQGTGFLFEAGDPIALAAAVRWVTEHRAAAEQWGEAARATYLSTYTGEQTYRQLVGIYRRAIEESRSRDRTT